MIRLATVGTSAICDKFLSAVKSVSGISHVAVYSRNDDTGKAFAKKHGVNSVYTDMEALAKSDEIDAVYIASPNKFHAGQSRIFLENGKSVICEKPITTSLSEYEELKSLADRNNLIYAEAIISRHTYGRNALLDAIGKIGKISIARLDFCQRSSRLDDFYAGKKMNIFDMSLHAGTLMDLGVYCVYAACDLFGKPKGVKFADKNLLSNGADGSGIAILDYGDFDAVLTYSKTGKSSFGSEIIGDCGTVAIESISQYAGIKLNGIEVFGFPDRTAVMRGEVEDFAKYVNGEETEEYGKISELCAAVCGVMDEIKKLAVIKYE